MNYNTKKKLSEDFDTTRVTTAKGLGKDGAVGVGDAEESIEYGPAPDPDNEKVMLPYTVTVNLFEAQKYVQNCINQICKTWPAFGEFLGGGNNALNVYIVDDDLVKTMATDRRNIYVNPFFLWTMAHKSTPDWAGWSEEDENKSKEEKTNLWPITDQGTIFVLMHEVYHCLHMHHLREQKFKAKHPEITNFSHKKANYVQDQEINAALEACCSFDYLQDMSGLQKGVVGLIGGVLIELDGTDGWNKVDDNTFKALYQGPFKVDEDGGIYAGFSYKEMLGTELERKYPTNFGGTWEDMYLYFEEHGWPNYEEEKDEPQGPGGPGGDGPEKPQPKDQEVYDAGYYDGYYGKQIDKQLQNNPDYRMGLEDGVKYRKIDEKYNTNINSPEYQQGVEDAKNGTVYEQRVFVDSKDKRFKNFNAIFEAFKSAKSRGFICEWRNIDRNSQAYKDGLASVNGQKQNQNNSGSSQQSSNNSQNQNNQNDPKRRGGQKPNDQNNQGQNGEEQDSQDGQQNDKSQGKRRGGNKPNQGQGQNQEGGENGQNQNGQDSQDGEGEGQGEGQGNQPKDGGQKGPAKRREPQYPPGVKPPKDPRGGKHGDGPKRPPKIGRPGMNDQLTPQQGEQILSKINGGDIDPKMDDPDEKWKEINLNEPMGPIDIDMSDLPEDVRKQAGNGWGKATLGAREKILEAMKSDINWQDMLVEYIRGAFRDWREKVNKQDIGRDADFIRKKEVSGGESIGNIAFALDQSGSMWGQTGKRDSNSSGGAPSSMKKFFHEIANIREMIGKPIKGIASFSFAANEPAFYADYFPEGMTTPDWNPIDKGGGTDFDNIFRLMKQGKVYDKKTGNRLWTGFDDTQDFPIVTIICTDGEDDVKNYKESAWDPEEKLIIWFVINKSPSYVQSFPKRLEKAGYKSTYYIGITTDQI